MPLRRRSHQVSCQQKAGETCGLTLAPARTLSMQQRSESGFLSWAVEISSATPPTELGSLIEGEVDDDAVALTYIAKDRTLRPSSENSMTAWAGSKPLSNFREGRSASGITV